MLLVATTTNVERSRFAIAHGLYMDWQLINNPSHIIIKKTSTRKNEKEKFKGSFFFARLNF